MRGGKNFEKQNFERSESLRWSKDGTISPNCMGCRENKCVGLWPKLESSMRQWYGENGAGRWLRESAQIQTWVVSEGEDVGGGNAEHPRRPADLSALGFS